MQTATPNSHTFVFCALWFYVDLDDDDGDRPYERTIMPGLVCDLVKARSLLHSPHLLRHVQQLTLWDWDHHNPRKAISAQPFYPDDKSDDPVNTQDVGNLILAVYEAITLLILHMPGLQQLKVMRSPMTPLLYTAICSLPRLNSFKFAMYDSHVIHEQSGPVDLPPTLHIRELRFYNTSANIYLSHILAGCITSLHTLSITSTNLPLIPSYICNRALPLKILQVEFLEETSADYDAHFALWDALRATPELRTLLIHGYDVDVPPPDDLCNHLCKLYQLFASPMTVQKLAEGKELDTIEICGPFHIREQSIAQTVPCTPTHLRQLTLHGVESKTQQELDNFISSFHVFQHLEYLDIDYHFPNSPDTDADFHESWEVIKYLWRKLKHLRRFNLRGFNGNEELYGIEAACPVDVDINDEPLSRGHPTLELIGVSFLRRSLWEWDPKHGWVSGRWSYGVWYDGSYTFWNRI